MRQNQIMSAYVELLEEKKEMGLISDEYAKSRKKHYDDLDSKINLDSQAKKKLAILKQDKSTFLTVELISLVNDTKKSTNTIKNWVTAFGIVWVLGLIYYLFNLLSL